MNYTIRRAQGDVARREQIVDLVTSRMQASEQYSAGVRARLPRLYDLWRGVYTGALHPHKNNVHIPLIFSAIWADAARKAATSLNIFPIVRFTGYGPDDAPIARKRESLISAQMVDLGMFHKQVDVFVTADLYGRAISQVGWRRTKEKRMIEEVATLPLSGRVIRMVRKGDVVTFDGPDLENVDRLDFYPEPGVKDLHKMRWVVRRYILDLDDVRALTAAGMFDRAELDRLEREGGVNAHIPADDAGIRRFQVRGGLTDEQARVMDRYSRPVELLEMWGYIPSELATDGVTMRVVTVANRRYLMRNRPHPYWHGKLPFVDFAPTPDPHYFDAPGKAEIAEKLQITANRYVNQGLDAADLTIDPMWFYDRQANLNTRNLISRPGRYIAVDGNPNQVVAPLLGNLQGLSVADAKLDLASRYAQMGMGIYDDAVMGAQGDSRQTAREFLGRREAAGTRLNLESMLYERGYLEPCANMMVALDKQFLDLPVEVLILGDAAVNDPVTGEPIQSSREQLDGYDMVPNYAARAYGAMSALSKGVMQTNLLQLSQMVSANQATMGAINQINFWRGIFREFEIPNINEIFQKAPPNALEQVLNQASGGAGIGAVPSTKELVNGAVPPGMEGAAPVGMPGVDAGGAPDMAAMLAGLQAAG